MKDDFFVFDCDCILFCENAGASVVTKEDQGCQVDLIIWVDVGKFCLF